MSKKTWILIACLVLSLTLGLGGSLAYLTDRDTKVNTFTMGDVDITLNENYQQGSAFVPNKPIEKEAWIENTGANDAWVWMTVALPRVLEGESVAAANDNYVHINTPGAFWFGYQDKENYWNSASATGIPIQSGEPSFPVNAEHTWKVDPECAPGQIVIIDGVEYYVETRLYNGILKPGEKTNYGISSVYLDAHVDYDPIENKYYYINNGSKTEINYDLSDVKIIVSAFAIQAEGFETVEDAYAAYMGQWTAEGKLTADMIDGITSKAPDAGAVRPAGYEAPVEGGVINNVVVTDNSGAGSNLRALYREGGIKGSLEVNDSSFDGTYAMNITTTGENATLTCENTLFAGWTSYSGFESVTFTNCIFRENTEREYNYLRAYDDTVLTNCELTGTTLSTLNENSVYTGATIKLVNCTYNGVAITKVEQLKIEAGSVGITIE